MVQLHMKLRRMALFVGDISDPIFTHTSLEPGTAHKYRVRAIRDKYISAWTAVVRKIRCLVLLMDWD